MGYVDGGFGDIDWGQLPQNSGDPLAESDWTDVFGQAAPYTPDFAGLGDTGGPANMAGNSSIQAILDSLKAKTSPQATMQPKGQPGSGLGDLSSVLGAFSSGEKANRVLQGNMTQGYDKLMLDAQAGRNTNESDALKKLAQTSYITGGGSKFAPASFQLNGQSRTAPDLGFGPPPVSDAEKAGASTLQSQLQARLSPGGSYVPQPLNDYAKPGLAENIGSYGAAGVGGLGSILNMLGGDQATTGQGMNESGTPGSVMSGISKGIGTAGTAAGLLSKAGLLGKSGGVGSTLGSAGSTIGGLASKYAIPGLGAATGIYGLAKNQNVGSDILSGAGAGASIGSIVPGVGTAIGAGVGALVGALRGAFSVTGKEHGGRDAQTAIAQNLSKLSTPDQQAEASKAGWPDPNQALSLIVMRDKLIQSGTPGPQAEAQAEQLMHSMWDAEKSGSDAVAKAATPLQSMMGLSTPTQPQLGSTIPGQPRLPSSMVTDAFSQGARG